MTFVKECCTIYTDMTRITPWRFPPNGNQSGFLLIEVLVALAILGIIAVAFLSALTTGYRGLLLAREMTMAESLVRTELERIRDAPYPIANEVRSSAGYDISVTACFVEAEPDPQNPDESRYLPAAISGSLQMITVTVTHQGRMLLTTTTNKAER